MKKSPFRFTFKPAMEPQREMIHQWLQQDYIREWVHRQGLQNTLSELEKFFHHQSQHKKLDPHTKITQHWIGYDNDKPFVYLLTSNVFKDTLNVYAQWCESNGFAITLDIFIGDKDYLGKGFATTIIKDFLLSQFSDVSKVFIDPEKTNLRAIHVYQKVGFQIVGEFVAPWHPVPHHVMKINMRDLRQHLMDN